MKNTNKYLQLIQKNGSNFAKINSYASRLQRILNLLTSDVLPSTASQRLRDVRSVQLDELQRILNKHNNFVDSEKTQKSINTMLHELQIEVTRYKYLQA